jgi:hypothetical protein
MAHEVRARFDTKVVAHKDLEVLVKSRGEKLGTLLISKGNLEWLPKGNSVNKYRVGWNRLATLIQEHGRAVKAKK